MSCRLSNYKKKKKNENITRIEQHYSKPGGYIFKGTVAMGSPIEVFRSVSIVRYILAVKNKVHLVTNQMKSLDFLSYKASV